MYMCMKKKNNYEGNNNPSYKYSPSEFAYLWIFAANLSTHSDQWEVSEAWQPHLSHSHLDQVQSTVSTEISIQSRRAMIHVSRCFFSFSTFCTCCLRKTRAAYITIGFILYSFTAFFHFSIKFTNKKGHFSFKSTTTNHIIQTYFTPIWLRPITAGRLIRLKPSIIFSN